MVMLHDETADDRRNEVGNSSGGTLDAVARNVELAQPVVMISGERECAPAIRSACGAGYSRDVPALHCGKDFSHMPAG